MKVEQDLIPADPLRVHFELKQRGSDFSKVARAISSAERPITAAIVRAVIYGVSARHHDLVLREIRRILKRRPLHSPR